MLEVYSCPAHSVSCSLATQEQQEELFQYILPQSYGCFLYPHSWGPVGVLCHSGKDADMQVSSDELPRRHRLSLICISGSFCSTVYSLCCSTNGDLSFNILEVVRFAHCSHFPWTLLIPSVKVTRALLCLWRPLQLEELSGGREWSSVGPIGRIYREHAVSHLK